MKGLNMNTTVNPAEEIAQAVLKELEGDGLLIEAICRALMKINLPNSNPDEPTEQGPLWEGYKQSALEYLVVDRILRGPGDKMAYERLLENLPSIKSEQQLRHFVEEGPHPLPGEEQDGS